MLNGYCFVCQQAQRALQEYFDWIFPDDAGVAPNLKFLEAARRWERSQTAQEAS